MKLPISFDQFKKNPVAGVAFISFVGIGYLYVDLRSSTKEEVAICREENKITKEQVQKLTEHIRRRDSALGYSQATILMQQNMLK
jgi:hypothetical protein